MFPLPDEAHIMRADRVPDGRGGHKTTWERLGRVKCRISGASSKDIQLAGANQVGIDAVMYYRDDLDIQSGYAVVVRNEWYRATTSVEPSKKAYKKVILSHVKN